MTRALALALVVGSALAARADINTRNYRELPGGEHRMVSSITVRPDDTAIPADERKRYAGQHPSGDYDVYIGREGTVDGIHVVRSLEGCDEFIAKHLATIRQTPKPPEPWVRHVTVELRFGDVATPSSIRAKNVPPHLFESLLVASPTPHLPDAVKRRARGELVGVYKICAATNGKVTTVAPLQSIPGADEAIMTTLRTWQITPQPMPICTSTRFVFAVAARK